MKKLLTLCLNCPCLNGDNEEGDSCNLGYSTGYVKAYNEDLNSRSTTHTMSPDCKLVKIIDGDLEILREDILVEVLEEPKFNKLVR